MAARISATIGAVRVLRSPGLFSVRVATRSTTSTRTRLIRRSVASRLASGDDCDLDLPLRPGQRRHGDQRRRGAVAGQEGIARRHHRRRGRGRRRRRSCTTRCRSGPCRPRRAARRCCARPRPPARRCRRRSSRRGGCRRSRRCAATAVTGRVDGEGVVGGGRGDRGGGERASVHGSRLAPVLHRVHDRLRRHCRRRVRPRRS